MPEKCNINVYMFDKYIFSSNKSAFRLIFAPRFRAPFHLQHTLSHPPLAACVFLGRCVCHFVHTWRETHTHLPSLDRILQCRNTFLNSNSILIYPPSISCISYYLHFLLPTRPQGLPHHFLHSKLTFCGWFE